LRRLRRRLQNVLIIRGRSVFAALRRDKGGFFTGVGEVGVFFDFGDELGGGFVGGDFGGRKVAGVGRVVREF